MFEVGGEVPGEPAVFPDHAILGAGDDDGLARTARRRNLRNAFAAQRLPGMPAHVVLIDDVMTTGATLHAAAHALRRAGVHRVDAWVCARVR